VEWRRRSLAAQRGDGHGGENGTSDAEDVPDGLAASTHTKASTNARIAS
jgi:hypothetical protein